MSSPKSVSPRRYILPISLLTALVVITICSKSSPIYPLNDWVDANCFLTVGKSILAGKVPYRDLFEQKGPLLYFLHALAALVSQRTFFGVYLLEIAACTAFLFFSFQTMGLLCPKASPVLIPILAAGVYSARAFCHGDSAEELCLPLLAFGLYVGLRAVRNRGSLSAGDCLLIGITSGCVLWIKFSMLGFYLGWIAVPALLMLKQGQLGKLVQSLLRIALGVALVSLPILAYFAWNHAISYLFEVYFYNNLFLYSVSSEATASASLLTNLMHGLESVRAFNAIALYAAALGALLFPWWKDPGGFFFLLTTAFATFLLVYMGGRCYPYYALILSVFAPIGLGALAGLLHGLCKGLRMSPQLQGGLCALICCACALFAYQNCNNTYLLRYQKADLPQYRFAQIINRTENPTLLNYGFLDGGFYTVAGIVPSCRYFCTLNIPFPEMTQAMDELIAQGGVDFVVTRDQQLQSHRYRCVDTASLYMEGRDREYFLYQLTK